MKYYLAIFGCLFYSNVVVDQKTTLVKETAMPCDGSADALRKILE